MTRSRRRPWRIVLFVLLLIVLVLFFWSMPAWSLMRTYAAWPVMPERPLYVLVAGVDANYSGYHTRAPEDFTGRTDTIVLLALNPAQHAVKFLSLPRDTRVSLPGYGYTKLNSANPRGGPSMLVSSVERLLDIEVDAYLLVSMDAPRDVVDALGGVELDVPARMRYQDTAAGLDIDLRPGKQRLDGRSAEGFLRFRHDALGDIGRAQRQQIFYRALLSRLKQPEGIWRAPSMARALFEHVRTDLSREDAARLLGFMLSNPRVDTLLLPGNFGGARGWSGYWLPREGEIEILVAEHLRGAEGQARPIEKLGVAVIDVGGGSERTRAALARLHERGFHGAYVARSSVELEQSVVLAGNEPEALELAQALGIAEWRVSGEGVLGADATIRVGRDFPLN